MIARLVICFCVVASVLAQDNVKDDTATDPLTSQASEIRPVYDNHQVESTVVSPPYIVQPQQQYAYAPMYAIKPGYHGLVIPEVLKKTTTGGIIGLLTVAAKKLKKASVFKKLAKVVLGVSILFLFGLIATTTICTFTPVCHLSIFGLSFPHESVRSLMTTDNLSRLTTMVHDAIEKYQNIDTESISNEITDDK